MKKILLLLTLINTSSVADSDIFKSNKPGVVDYFEAFGFRFFS